MLRCGTVGRAAAQYRTVGHPHLRRDLAPPIVSNTPEVAHVTGMGI